MDTETFRSTDFLWQRRPWLVKLALRLWLGLALGLVVESIVEPIHHTTYPIFETGARRWWSEKDIYRRPKACPDVFRYGPAFAVGLGPLAALPTWAGGALWNLLNVGALFAALRALVRRVLPGPWSARREAVYLILAMPVALRMLWASQSNALIVAMVAGAAVAVTRQRWWLAALLLALPVHIKVWPLAAALLMIALWPRQLSWRFAASLAAVGAVPFLTKPFAYVCQQYAGWYAMLAGPAQIRHDYRDAWTLWELFCPPVPPAAYAALQLAAAAAVLGLCLYQARLTASSGRRLTFLLALWMVWQLVFGPGTERSTFGLIAPLLAWGLLSAWTQRRGRWWMVLAYGLAVASAVGDIERVLVGAVPAVAAAHPVAMLLFAAWLLTQGGWVLPAANEDPTEHAPQDLATMGGDR